MKEKISSVFFIISALLQAQEIKITVHPDTLFSVDHRIFGHFLERPSWGGELGIEDAVLEKTGELDPRVLEKLKGLDIPVLRFPGGTDVDYMDWTDMIDLPGREKRPVSTGNSGGKVTNRFGLDEFAALVRELDCEAIIPLNFFDAFLKRQPLDSAAYHMAGLVAYANADTGQVLPVGMRDWPAIRAANGNPRPFNFRYIQIGNETFALWQWKKNLVTEAGITRPYDRYVECVERYVDLVKAVDPDVEIIVDYIDRSMQEKLVETLGDRIDYYVFHKYMPWAMKPENIKKDGERIPANQLSYEEVWNAFVSVPNTLDDRHMSSIGSALIGQAEKYDLKIAVTEWNWNGWWDGASGAPLRSRYGQAVGVAGFLHGMVRNGHVIKMGCQSMLVGSSWGITGIRVDDDGRQDPYYLPTSQMTSFYAEHHGDYLLRMDVENIPTLKQPVQLAGIRPKQKVAVIDVLTTGSERDVSIFYINRDYREAKTVTIDLSRFDNMASMGEHVIMTGIVHDSKVYPPDDPYIFINREEVEINHSKCTVELPARSVSVLKVTFDGSTVGESGPPASSYYLGQNYPNPLNAATTIEYGLTRSDACSLQLYNVQGRLVRTLVDKKSLKGRFRAVWDGTDDNGHAVPSGIYFYRLQTGEFSQSRQLVLLK